MSLDAAFEGTSHGAWQPIETGSVVDGVVSAIRRAVLTGMLPPGKNFSISKITNELGVSHIPVREALRRLEAEGLVVLRPGRSAMVSPLTREELRSIFRLRRLIEPDLAARSCALLTEDDLQLVDNLIAEYGNADEGSDELWKCHRELHLALMRPAASEWDLRILDQLWHASNRYTRIVFDPYALKTDERKRREHAHRTLVAAAHSGSPAELRNAVIEHLMENEAKCLDRIAAFRIDASAKELEPES